eukprot:g5792.t1
MNSLNTNFENASVSADDESIHARMDNDDAADRPFSKTQKMAVKFLLSNIAAGVIIGKGGTNITDLQQESNARIQLSRNNEFYPGTNERVMLISGTVKSVLTALFLILKKLAAARKGVNALDKTRHENTSQNLASSLKIVMPSACCGAILGRGGRTVKQFVEDSGAAISVLAQTYVCQEMDSRVISISGGMEQMLRAVALVVTKVAGDPQYINNVSLSVNCVRPTYSSQATAYSMYPSEELSVQYSQCNATMPVPHPQTMVYPAASYPQMEHPAASFGPMKYCHQTMGTASPTQPSDTEMHSALPPSQQSHMTNAAIAMATNGCLQIPTNPGGPRIEMNVSVPDERIGAIIGRGGEIITQLQTLVGVKIIISGRNEFEPGTRNRRVTIIGSPDAVHIAHMLISMKERSMTIPPVFNNLYNWSVPAAWMGSPVSPSSPDGHCYN